MEVGASLFLTQTELRHARWRAPPTVIHPPAHPVAVSGEPGTPPLSVRLWLPASVLVIVILPDLLARSWRQESPCLPSATPDPMDNSDQLLQGALSSPTHYIHTCFFCSFGLGKKQKKTPCAFFGGLSVSAWGITAVSQQFDNWRSSCSATSRR